MTIGERVCSRIAAISPPGSDVAAGRVNDDLEVAAGESGRRLADVLAPADEVELWMGRERVAEPVEPVARTGDVDPDALAHGRLSGHHCPPAWSRSSWVPRRPSRRIEFASRRVSGLSLALIGGRSCERPVAVLEHMEELLHLDVGDGEQHREVRRPRARASRRSRARRGRLQDLDVAEDDPRARGSRLLRARLDRGDDVDAVAGLEGAGEQLVLVARELERAHGALELCADAPLGRASRSGGS